MAIVRGHDESYGGQESEKGFLLQINKGETCNSLLDNAPLDTLSKRESYSDKDHNPDDFHFFPNAQVWSRF